MNKNDLITTVNNAKRGDKKAFETLYSEYYSNLYFFVLKNVKNKETAEDITQEAFLKAMKSLETLARPETFETWLHSIAYNKCMDNFRAESRNACFETDEEKEQAIENSALNSPVMLPEDYAVNEDRKRELADLIDRLKPDMRSALILYYYNDMSISEVASSLGMNENAAKQKLFLARKKLRAQIEKLYGKAGSYLREALNGEKPAEVFDLYCGTGTITQIISPYASHVTGVEIVPEAVEAAKENAAANSITNCDFICGDVFKVLDSLDKKPDYIIVDPPREGLQPKALTKILSYEVPSIIYIACKPQSLARDIPAFLNAGYEVRRLACVDMFPRTGNAEMTSLFSRQ